MSAYVYDLGTYRRTITTESRDAQAWFDRGLAWTYGYNHDEAIACYRRAIDADPECAMAWWGIAYAVGPNYNKPWEAFDDEDASRSLALARDAVAQAEGLAHRASDTECALIRALARRYPSRVPAADMCPWNDDYAAAMRAVHAEHAEDPDVEALFAEAIMNRTPWALWDLETGSVAQDHFFVVIAGRRSVRGCLPRRRRPPHEAQTDSQTTKYSSQWAAEHALITPLPDKKFALKRRRGCGHRGGD